MKNPQNLTPTHSNNKYFSKVNSSKAKAAYYSNGHEALNSNDPPNITNKTLYLQYVQKVLRDKQNDLIELQQTLTSRQAHLNQVQFSKGIGQLIAQMQQIKMMERKLKHTQAKMGIKDQDYLSLYHKIQNQSAKCKIDMENTFKKQYEDLMEERRLLRTKISQFAQLQAYEKYLNELHQALQAKSQQLLQRQSVVQQSEIKSKNSQSNSYDMKKLQDLPSNKKRVKIFNAKPNAISDHPQNYQIHSNQHYQNETFAGNNIQQTNQFNESSAIMGEDSKNWQHLQRFDNCGDDYKQNISFQGHKDQYQIQQYHCSNSFKSNVGTNCSVQVDQETLDQAGLRLRKQALIIKYAAKWFKTIIYSQKCPTNKKKAVGVDLWRLNTTFDISISESAKQNIGTLQNIWKKQQKLLYESKMFPYNQLSLKRKKYAQLMFDLQQKMFYRKRILLQLRLILKNKYRKQRLIFYMYFCKFMRNCTHTTHANRITKDRARLCQTRGTVGVTQSYSELASVTSSQIRNEQKIAKPNKKPISHVHGHEKSSSASKRQSRCRYIPKQIQSQHLELQKFQTISEQKQTQQQKILKMKQILSQKQKTQRLLATQCVKLQGLIKMSMVLVSSTFRTYNSAIKQLFQSQYQQKLNDLTVQLNSLQFKFDLVVTKCRLGLANNSNKITTLQNLLDFTHLIK